MVLKVGQPEYLLGKEGWAAQETEEAVSDDMTLCVSVSGKFKGKQVLWCKGPESREPQNLHLDQIPACLVIKLGSFAQCPASQTLRC